MLLVPLVLTQPSALPRLPAATEVRVSAKWQKGAGTTATMGGDAPEDRAPPTQRSPACPLRPSVDGSPRIPPEIGVEMGIRAPQAPALPPEGVTTRACGRRSLPPKRLRPAAALAASSMARLRSPRWTRRCAWILPPLVSEPSVAVVMSRNTPEIVLPVDWGDSSYGCRPFKWESPSGARRAEFKS